MGGQLGVVGPRKGRRRRAGHERRLGRAEAIPREIVPGVARIIRGIRRCIGRGLVGDVHAEARLAGHFLDDEEPAALVVRENSLLSTVAACALLDREVEAEEAQIGIDLGAEQRKLELLVELVGREVVVLITFDCRWPSSMAFCA